MYKLTIYLSTLVIVLCSIFADIYAKPNIKFNGDAQYRFRFDYIVAKNEEGTDSSAAPDYSNRYAWNLKWKITVSENLLFGIRLSNPLGYQTDNIADNMKQVSENNYNILSVPELYFKWSAGIFSLSAGIIPVKANTVLNLIAHEPNERDAIPGSTLAYKSARDYTWYPWNVLMNNSQKGIDLGFDFINKKELSFGMNLISSMANDAPGTDKADAFLLDQVRFILSFPTSFSENKISLLPVMHVRTNAYRSGDEDHKYTDHSLAGGCDIVYSPIEALGIKVGLAGGMYKNECQKGDSINIDDDPQLEPVPQTAPLGILLNSGITVLPGYGKASVFFAFVQARDREADPSLKNNTLFWDIKYGMPIKKLTIMPRCRIWYDTREDYDDAVTMLRPELILMANF
jgi:hypothetical protein